MTVHMPSTLTEATELLAKNPEARLLAGGTDTMVEVNFNRFRPNDIIGLRNIDELQNVTLGESEIVIGAGVTWSTIETGRIARALPALAAAARTVGSPQIRAAGTLGGNLGTCSPAGDGLPVLAALDARINLRSIRGSRSVAFADFMTGVKRNCRATDELIESISVPLTSGYQDYAKVGVRNAMVISVAGLCVVHDTRTKSMRVGLGAVGPTIIRAVEAEQWISAQTDLSQTPPRDESLADGFAERVAQAARPITDHRSTSDYRRHAIRVLARRLYLRSAR